MIKRIFSVQSLEGYKQEMKRGYISKFGAPIAVNLMHADDGWPIDRFASSGNVFGLAVWLALYIFSTDPIIEETRMHIAFDLYSRACRSVFSSTGLASATCAWKPVRWDLSAGNIRFQCILYLWHYFCWKSETVVVHDLAKLLSPVRFTYRILGCQGKDFFEEGYFQRPLHHMRRWQPAHTQEDVCLQFLQLYFYGRLRKDRWSLVTASTVSTDSPHNLPHVRVQENWR